jgi:glycosyltransferase involved in cell wall biosynthesis
MSRILLLTPIAPYPADSGAAQRSFLLYQSLSRQAPVDLVLVGDDTLAPQVRQVLESQFNLVGQIEQDSGGMPPRRWNYKIPLIGTPLRRGTRVVFGSKLTLFRSARMAKALADVLARRDYMAVATRYLWPATQTDAFAHLPVFIDVDDLPSEMWFSRAAAAKVPGSLGARCAERMAHSYQAHERVELARAAGVWVAKDKDMAALPDRPARLLPNVPFASYPDGVQPLPQPQGSAPVLLGVALFDWPPNRAGFDWFVKKVWPLVHAQRPDARLHLVGKLSDPDTQRAWQATPGVHCLGRVDDLQAAYQAAHIAVAPIFTGGGTNIKVVEALSYGRCCVVTPHAAKGFEGLSGLHTASEPAAFAQACLSLLAAPEQAAQEGQQASRSAGRVFSYAGFAQAVQAVLGGALPTRRAP